MAAALLSGYHKPAIHFCKAKASPNESPPSFRLAGWDGSQRAGGRVVH